MKRNGNKFIFLFLLSLIGHYNLFSQENKTIDCKKIVLEADSLFNKVGDLKKSILFYTHDTF